MPRIPYVCPPPGADAVADTIRARRAGGALIALDGVLLNAPAVAAGYSALLDAVRRQTSLDAALRELLILRVAALNGAAYEWIEHEPLARAAGLTDAQLAAIRDVSYVHRGPVVLAEPTHAVPSPSSSPAAAPPLPPTHTAALSPKQAAALAYTDAMTAHVHVPPRTFAALQTHCASAREIMEITATVAAYNLVSRVLVALDVGDMAHADVPIMPRNGAVDAPREDDAA